MAINLSIKDVPDEIAERLRLRAARNHRSLQGELMCIVERAAGDTMADGTSFAPRTGGAGRSWVQGWKSVEQLLAEREAAGWQPDPRMAALPRGVDIIRADRDGR